MSKISSPHNERIKKAVQLHSSRGRKRQQRFIVFGWREVQRCLLAGGQVAEVFVRNRDAFFDSERLFELAGKCRAQVIDVDDAVFDKLKYGERDDGVVAVVDRPHLPLESLDLNASAFCLVLEGVEKPGNLGAIYRSCDGAGVDALIIVDPLTDLFHPNSIRASMGTVFSVPTAITQAAELIPWLQKKGIRILAARPDASCLYCDQDLTQSTAIALGNEAEGLSDAWLEANVIPIKLPMLGVADSLNVSVTASILVYESRRQRS